jgi:hypothetical protein
MHRDALGAQPDKIRLGSAETIQLFAKLPDRNGRAFKRACCRFKRDDVSLIIRISGCRGMLPIPRLSEKDVVGDPVARSYGWLPDSPV